MTATEDLRSYTSSYINNVRRTEKFPASLVTNSHSAVVLSPGLSSLVFGLLGANVDFASQHLNFQTIQLCLITSKLYEG